MELPSLKQLLLEFEDNPTPESAWALQVAIVQYQQEFEKATAAGPVQQRAFFERKAELESNISF